MSIIVVLDTHTHTHTHTHEYMTNYFQTFSYFVLFFFLVCLVYKIICFLLSCFEFSFVRFVHILCVVNCGMTLEVLFLTKPQENYRIYTPIFQNGHDTTCSRNKDGGRRQTNQSRETIGQENHAIYAHNYDRTFDFYPTHLKPAT